MKDNPIHSQARNLFFYLLFWFFMTAIYLNLILFSSDITFFTALIDSLVFNILLAGLGLSFWFSARYISIDQNPVFKIVLIHSAGGVIVSAIWLTAGYLIMTVIFNYSSAYSEFFINTLPWRFLIGILIYFLIISFYYVIIYYSGFQERIIKESDLRNLVTEAELRSLKFQINPHFIFNSLNSMSALTTIDPERAKEMIIKLADFLRYTLANNDKQTTLLSEELKNIRLYLDIEKIRFEDKFVYVEQIDADVLSREVPNMILQPMFENAIKHAVYETLGKVKLELSAKQENDFVRITLRNNFDEFPAANKKGTGTGLKNIRERLALIYGQNDLLEISRDENIFRVTLFIPVTQKELLLT